MSGWEDCYELWGEGDWEKFCRTKRYWPRMPKNTAILSPPVWVTDVRDNPVPYRNLMFAGFTDPTKPGELTWTLKISGCAGLEQLRVRKGNYYCNNGAFQDMQDLRSVLFLGDVVLSEDCFQNCPEISKIYVKGDARILGEQGVNACILDAQGGVLTSTGVPVFVKGDVYKGMETRPLSQGLGEMGVHKTDCNRTRRGPIMSAARRTALRAVNMPRTMCSDSVRLATVRRDQHRHMERYLEMQRDMDKKWKIARAALKRQRTAKRGRGVDTEKRDAKQARTKVDFNDLSEFYPTPRVPTDIESSDEDDVFGYNPFDTGTNDIFDQNLNPFLRLRF